MTVGDTIGRPLAEWAYVTPRYPQGIKASDLKIADQAIQLETALLWFQANFKRYDLTGGHWFTFNAPGRGFGQAPFAPSPLTSKDIFEQEIGQSLHFDVRRQLNNIFDGQWMWAGGIVQLAEGDNASDTNLLKVQLGQHLEALIKAIESLEPQYGGPGHNLALEDVPLTPEERRSTLVALGDAKLVLSGSSAVLPTMLENLCATMAPIATKLGSWLLCRIDDFGTEFAKAAGRSLGEKVPALIVATSAAVTIWHEWNSIEEIIRQLLK